MARECFLTSVFVREFGLVFQQPVFWQILKRVKNMWHVSTARVAKPILKTRLVEVVHAEKRAHGDTMVVQQVFLSSIGGY